MRHKQVAGIKNSWFDSIWRIRYWDRITDSKWFFAKGSKRAKKTPNWLSCSENKIPKETVRNIEVRKLGKK